jgi:Aspartyl protease
MRSETMGRVTVRAIVENLEDQVLAEGGSRKKSEVRRVEVPDALVDTGASNLSMPSDLIQKLGFKLYRHRRTMTAGRPRQTGVYSAVRLTIQDRDCIVEVNELPPTAALCLSDRFRWKRWIGSSTQTPSD